MYKSKNVFCPIENMKAAYVNELIKCGLTEKLALTCSWHHSIYRLTYVDGGGCKEIYTLHPVRIIRRLGKFGFVHIHKYEFNQMRYRPVRRGSVRELLRQINRIEEELG